MYKTKEEEWVFVLDNFAEDLRQDENLNTDPDLQRELRVFEEVITYIKEAKSK